MMKTVFKMKKFSFGCFCDHNCYYYEELFYFSCKELLTYCSVKRSNDLHHCPATFKKNVFSKLSVQ